MPTQNRYYSNLGYTAQLANTSGINNVQTSIQVSSAVNWPTAFPFVVSIEPGTANEELVLISAGSGTSLSPFIATSGGISGRGFDGTTALPHPVGAYVVPKICQLDLAQPQQHINEVTASSGVHGLPANAWSGGTMQLVGTKQVLGSSQTTVTFNNASYFSTIPSTCNNVVIYGTCKSTYTLSAVEDIMLQLNGFAGANYGDSFNQTTGISSGSPSITAKGDINQTQAVCGLCTTAVSSPNIVTHTIITFPSFNDAVWAKGYNFQSAATDGASASNSYSSSGGGVCNQVTGALTSVSLTPQFAGSGSQFVANSVFTMYAY